MTHQILVATRNDGKIREISRILGGDFELIDLSAMEGMPEVEETGQTFEENAELKAVAASRQFDGWVIADDSGLEADALGGAPGVISARFAGPAATDSENSTLLLQRMEGVRGKARSARFRCVIVLARSGRKLAAFHGCVEGVLAPAPRGDRGFGYDPLFIPQGSCQTFAELPPETKNSISHRARALEQLRDWGGWG